MIHSVMDKPFHPMGERLSSLEGKSGSKDSSFLMELERSVDEVNGLLREADRKSTELVTGKSENLHGAMITMEKAETALKLLVQIRNKAIEAYHEVMRMQV